MYQIEQFCQNALSQKNFLKKIKNLEKLFFEYVNGVGVDYTYIRGGVVGSDKVRFFARVPCFLAF